MTKNEIEIIIHNKTIGYLVDLSGEEIKEAVVTGSFDVDKKFELKEMSKSIKGNIELSKAAREIWENKDLVQLKLIVPLTIREFYNLDKASIPSRTNLIVRDKNGAPIITIEKANVNNDEG